MPHLVLMFVSGWLIRSSLTEGNSDLKKVANFLLLMGGILALVIGINR